MIVALVVIIVATVAYYFFGGNEELQKGSFCIVVLFALGQAFRELLPKPKKVMRETEEQANPDGSDEAPEETGHTVNSSTPTASADVRDELLDRFLKNCKFSGLECLYALEKAWQNNRPLQSREIITHMGERFYGYFYGFVIAARAMSLVRFSASRGRWTISWIHPRIKETLVGAINARLGPKRQPSFDKLKAMLEVE